MGGYLTTLVACGGVSNDLLTPLVACGGVSNDLALLRADTDRSVKLEEIVDAFKRSMNFMIENCEESVGTYSKERTEYLEKALAAKKARNKRQAIHYYRLSKDRETYINVVLTRKERLDSIVNRTHEMVQTKMSLSYMQSAGKIIQKTATGGNTEDDIDNFLEGLSLSAEQVTEFATMCDEAAKGMNSIIKTEHNSEDMYEDEDELWKELDVLMLEDTKVPSSVAGQHRDEVNNLEIPLMPIVETIPTKKPSRRKDTNVSANFM